MESQAKGYSSPISCEVLDIGGNSAREESQSRRKLEFEDRDDLFNVNVPNEDEDEDESDKICITQWMEQICSGIDENAVGTCSELVFAPIDVLFPDDAPLLPSAFRVIPLDPKSVELSVF
ncbi:hypothetical protein Vadar_030811 [Vaccinium darrowii]|uniref:Uncharacterized protein n=1 Tax=Vaccinium darrowii TaxID=229202 RepID=A0ACB7YT01_9ERIC|nr:hypothetical protein Vadar_030811 [Vaccinium darrowii]